MVASSAAFDVVDVVLASVVVVVEDDESFELQPAAPRTRKTAAAAATALRERTVMTDSRTSDVRDNRTPAPSPRTWT
jgi:hypothetical protein